MNEEMRKDKEDRTRRVKEKKEQLRQMRTQIANAKVCAVAACIISDF